jgi:hypothetical protein
MPSSELAPPFDLSTTITPLSGLCEKAESVTTLSREQRDQLYRVLASHHVVFNGLPGRMHKYAHEIKMHDQTPFVKRAYPIAFSLRPQVEKTIRNMERTGVIKRESSPFASPITVVNKKDGTVRVCLDARWVNQQMVADCEAPRPPRRCSTFVPVHPVHVRDRSPVFLLANSIEPVKHPVHGFPFQWAVVHLPSVTIRSEDGGRGFQSSDGCCFGSRSA